MKIIFMGTPEFAVSCLNRVINDGHDVVLVVTQADKPKGRGLTLALPPVKVCALTHGIEVYQPLKLKNNKEAWEIINKCQADAIVVVAYGQILPPEILELPKYGCINVHASLLPKYRGAAPIQWAVINGEEQTGVTTMLMDKGLDTGDMLLKRSVEIMPDMTAGELHDLLAQEGAAALSDTLELMKSGRLNPIKQDNSLSSYAPILTRDLSPIDFNKPAISVHNLIRGLNPWPSAYTKVGGKTLKVHSACPINQDRASPGTVISTSPLTIACGDNTAIELIEVQLEGAKRMASDVYLRGHPLEIGRVLPD
ncbi:MAG: methionyl-tRNA formyltransferase [Oscillospiraceae bacterium]|nr:methionyl-tRNA formyltransferase [Oscillospiraceae bacterium]MDD3832300.1 methionyl-tRNA formyltransferase [Oscillospiraceae bacterium]MDD4546093.1 methionyl-tRNA formyltransferase [Oscillospiraceae bacterium]